MSPNDSASRNDTASPNNTDTGLHERIIAGDDDALAEVYDRWSVLVYTLAVRITRNHATAQDVTQEVFVRLWERPEAYDPARGTLRTWLCMTARGRAIDAVRRDQTREHYHAVSGAQPPNLAEVDDALIWQTEAKVVRQAVQALPAPQREAIILAYHKGHTYRQVAQLLNIPEGTAKSRLRQALATLAERLESDGILER